ncbi:Mitochondrial chaperone bcs1-b, partial [Globisporangium splendens]
MDMEAVSTVLGAVSSPLLQPAKSANGTAAGDAATSPSSLLLDAIMLVAVPILLQLLLTPTGMKDALFKLRGALIGDPNAGFVFREITATTTYGDYYVMDESVHRHGHLLQKAILAHLTEVLQSTLRGRDIRYEMVERELSDEAAEDLEKLKPSDAAKDDDDDVYYSDDEPSESAQYEAINRLRIGSMPKLGEWIEVQPKVFFKQSILLPPPPEDNEGNERSSILTGKPKDVVSLFQFKSNAVDGAKMIDKIIDEAFVKYQMLELAKLASDKKKYMYVQSHQVEKPKEDEDNENGKKKSSSTKTVVYKRYALGEEKTFANLFFDEKEPLLRLLNNFMDHSGKFSIKGFPYKLGLLLYGPPGTGKTSLIKAVAHHTKRHIVTISLGKIQTNQELMNALFDLRFSVEGVTLPVNMTFEDVVFVMEDIDCAASVVMARENKSGKERRYKRSSPWAPSASDKLNLSGLLNVLDGVIDCPGRIVIMTTNHPEKLDPALIRPGRVNKKLELGYMSRESIREMVEYYSLAKFTSEQEATLCALVKEGGQSKITPATVEALSAEYDDIDSMLQALKLLQSANGTETWMS